MLREPKAAFLSMPHSFMADIMVMVGPDFLNFTFLFSTSITLSAIVYGGSVMVSWKTIVTCVAGDVCVGTSGC